MIHLSFSLINSGKKNRCLCRTQEQCSREGAAFNRRGKIQLRAFVSLCEIPLGQQKRRKVHSKQGIIVIFLP